MNRDNFAREIQSKNIKRIYVLEGEEEYLKKLGLDYAIKTLVNADFKDLNISYLTNPDVQTLIETAQIQPLMSDYRLVIVNDFNLLGSVANKGKETKSKKSDVKKPPKDDADILINYITEIPEYTVIFILIKAYADSRKKLTQAIIDNDSLVSFTPLTNNDSIKWITREVNKSKKQISYDAAQKLQYSVGNDAAIFKNEIDKLIAYVDNADSINQTDIDNISSKSINYSVFNMTDALLSLNINNAIRIAKNLLKNGEAEYMLFAMLLREFRISYYIKSLVREKVNINEIQKIAEIPSFAVNKRLDIIKKYSLNVLFDAYQYCINTDYLFKSGQISQTGITERSIYGIVALLKSGD